MSTESSAWVSLMGRCGAIEELRARVAQFAPSDVRVHVCGETGTGKEKVARALHRLSARATGPFVPVNVAGFSDELFCPRCSATQRERSRAPSPSATATWRAPRAARFSSTRSRTCPRSRRCVCCVSCRSASTCGSARRGPRKADVRVVSATNVHLDERVRDGHFRDDLLWRLREATVEVPPLRERGSDILHLARHFLRLQAAVRGERPARSRRRPRPRSFATPGRETCGSSRARCGGSASSPAGARSRSRISPTRCAGRARAQAWRPARRPRQGAVRADLPRAAPQRQREGARRAGARHHAAGARGQDPSPPAGHVRRLRVLSSRAVPRAGGAGGACRPRARVAIRGRGRACGP